MTTALVAERLTLRWAWPALELIATVMSLRRGVIPPTLNFLECGGNRSGGAGTGPRTCSPHGPGLDDSGMLDTPDEGDVLGRLARLYDHLPGHGKAAFRQALRRGGWR